MAPDPWLGSLSQRIAALHKKGYRPVGTVGQGRNAAVHNFCLRADEGGICLGFGEGEAVGSRCGSWQTMIVRNLG